MSESNIHRMISVIVVIGAHPDRHAGQQMSESWCPTYLAIWYPVIDTTSGLLRLLLLSTKPRHTTY